MEVRSDIDIDNMEEAVPGYICGDVGLCRWVDDGARGI
jgi:hypothetical protein